MRALVNLRAGWRLEEADRAAEELRRHEAHGAHVGPLDWIVGIEGVGAVVAARRDEQVVLGAQVLHLLVVLGASGHSRAGRLADSGRRRLILTRCRRRQRQWLEVEEVGGVAPTPRGAPTTAAIHIHPRRRRWHEIRELLLRPVVVLLLLTALAAHSSRSLPHVAHLARAAIQVIFEGAHAARPR